MINMINRGRIKDLAVIEEFEHLFAKLRGFLTQSFDSDGELIQPDPTSGVFSIGDYKHSAQTADHTFFLLADGRQVSRVTYKPLFDVIGTTYGVGDGATTFNIPDGRGRFLLGKAASGTGSTIGATGGALDHTHDLGDHSHSISSDGAHTHTMGNHTHTGTTDAPFGFVTNVDTDAPDVAAGGTHYHDFTTAGPSTNTTSSDGAHTHGGNTGTTSSGTSDGANPAFIVGNIFIYTGVA